MSYRLRFAPSPTGQLHVGGARTAILNWLLARHHGGTFVLRIEDTDVQRNVAAAEQVILDDLRWLGLDWDEGPDVGGPFGPYRQSDRGPAHTAAVLALVQRGAAYVCTCPPFVAAGEGDDEEPGGGDRRARCPCADRAGGQIVPGASVRFRAPEREVRVVDLVRGEVVFPPGSIEDFVLLRGNGRATYNLAAAVDDAAMEITHVIRGADHLVNTPKQVLLYEALGRKVPNFAHIPLILGEDRQKLSKRHGATSVGEHRRLGFMPEAMVNYLSLLSWSSPTGEEFLPPEKLIAEVDLDRVGASDAVFDTEKLRWLSSRYLQDLPQPALVERLRPFVDMQRFGLTETTLPAAAEALRKRISVLSEANDLLATFLGPLGELQRQARGALAGDEGAVRVLAALRMRLDLLSEWTEEGIDKAIRAAGADAGAKGKALFVPLRLALTGEEHGPELWRVVYLLGKERTLRLLDPEEAV